MQRALFLASILAIGLAVPVMAQQKADLPQSGTFKLHSGWKAVGETTPIADDHVFGSGNFWGVTYNDTGTGPLHNGAVVCPYTLDTIKGAGTAQGTCAWGDADGDKILTSYSGKISSSGSLDGLNQITGGTGKFSGIKGQAPFQCKFVNDKGQVTCTQQFEYRLTSEATGTTGTTK
jgi:hypothetical protein